MKRKALRVRPEAHIPLYVTEAEPRKQHSDSPLCNSLHKSHGHPYPVGNSTYRLSLTLKFFYYLCGEF